jgi:uncharacterized caspase-like protein
MWMRRSLLGLSALVLSASLAYAEAEPRSGDYHALVVGVDAYQKIRPLEYCVEDAKLLRDALIRNGFSRSHVVLLTDDAPIERRRPTLSNLYDALDELATRADEDDTIFFAFSGHGMYKGGSDYLMPIDASATSPQDTALELKDVTKRLRASGARRVVMSMDACRDLKEGKSTGGSGFGTRSLSIDAEGDGLMMMLFSCDAQEQSHEWTEKAHGVFTYYLVRAINGDATGSDDRVTVGELEDYLSARVTSWARERGYRQNPQVEYGQSAGREIRDVTFAIPGGTAAVRGRVFEAGSETPVARVVVHMNELETQTDEDGRYSFDAVASGAVEVRARPDDPYQQPSSISAMAYPGTELEVNFPLQRADLGAITVNTQPWAHVLLDDERAGDTPLTIANVEPGEHVLKLRLKGRMHKEKQVTVTVKAGETERVTLADQ